MEQPRLLSFLYQRYQQYPSILKTVLLTAVLMAILVPICRYTGLKNAEIEKLHDAYFAETTPLALFKETIILTPIIEEVIFRGPAWLALLFLTGLIKVYKKYKKSEFWLEKKISGGIPIWHLFIWPLIIVPAIFWSMDHPYPLPLFIFGLILGWLLLKTGSLIQVIAVHMMFNAFSVIGELIRILILI